MPFTEQHTAPRKARQAAVLSRWPTAAFLDHPLSFREQVVMLESNIIEKDIRWKT